jgi:hypothetical protein
MTAKPFFIVSSGRSGTAMLVKALSAAPGVTIEHEYMVHIVQPLAVRRYHGLATPENARAVLSTTHGAALAYAHTPSWGDSSNKLSWLIPELASLFPEARFVHLARDGRKVASSFFHKLGAECYDDVSTKILADYLDDPDGVPAPPPEKKYWWPQPKRGDPFGREFESFNQFQRIVWHWAEVNRVILDGLAAVPEDRQRFFRLEDLRSDPFFVATLFEFLGLPYRQEYAAAFGRPHNVNRPVDHLLTDEQSAQFDRVAGAMMERLAYAGRAEYVVNY